MNLSATVLLIHIRVYKWVSENPGIGVAVLFQVPYNHDHIGISSYVSYGKVYQTTETNDFIVIVPIYLVSMLNNKRVKCACIL